MRKMLGAPGHHLISQFLLCFPKTSQIASVVMGVLFEIEDLAFSHGPKPVLAGLSASLESGKFHGIIGPNGCGKSTLVDLLIHHKKPERGRIRYRGKPLSDYTRTALSKEIALVPQNFYINFPFTAAEVVAMGRYPRISRFARPSENDIRVIRQVMERTDTLRFKDRYVTQLSGGERQRVIFARALAQDARVLVMDEPTSNLDINHAINVMKLAFEGVRQESKTAVAVMQDINLAAVFCDSLIFMRDGKIVAQGPVRDVLTSDILDQVFDVESKVYDEPYLDAPQALFTVNS